MFLNVSKFTSVLFVQNMKDRNDELIGELEVAKQQMMMRRPRRSLPSTAMSLIPVRDGMSLSEYFTKRRNSLTSITSNGTFLWQN